MIWSNPWAWLGLGAIAVPILIHLLARQASKPVPFPTLRFLRATPLVDVRRRRLTDLLLLAIRIGIVALAVAALAQPFFRSGSSSTRESHLVIVDTTESVDADAARAAVQSYARDGGAVTPIARRDLRGAMQEARVWALASRGASTVVVISDFQRGALDAAAIAGVPETAGVRLHRVTSRVSGAPVIAGVQSVAIEGSRTRAAWNAAPVPTASAIRVESAHDAATNTAIVDAASATASAHPGVSRPALFVLPGSPRHNDLVASSHSPIEPWMFDLFASITRGRAATVRVIDGVPTVFLATDDPAEAADAIREALPALAATTPLQEFEPAVLTDDELRGMERAAAPGAPAESAGVWAGRWFWIGALLLLGVESLVRRSRRAGGEEEVSLAA